MDQPINRLNFFNLKKQNNGNTTSGETIKQKIKKIFNRPKENFLNKKQKLFWETLEKNEITLCFGPAGTGKSFISIKKALDLLWDSNNKYEKIMILRPSVVSGTNLGFLPGDLMEKLEPYMSPTFYLLKKIVGKETAKLLTQEDFIEIGSIAYLRGWNLDNTIMILEEAQNTSPIEMKLVLTRIGFNSKFFISGDLEQSDRFDNYKESGLYDAISRLDGVNKIGIFEFHNEDIVRNDLIKDILHRYSRK